MVSGSLAYFTDTDEVKNTFTVGSVKIEIFENDKATDSDTMTFGKLTPVVNMADPSKDVSYMPKSVKVKNTGANAAFIRTHIAIPTALVGYLATDMTAEGWKCIEDSAAKVGDVDYTVFTYDYETAVAPQDFTKELLKGVYLSSEVDLEEDANGNLVFVLRDSAGKVFDNSGFVAHTKNADGSYTSKEVNVLVASQAIQAEGFENGATNALNSGFTDNPWQ